MLRRMPEGHTIHRLARDLTRDLVGQRLEVSSPQGRFTDAERVTGTKLVRASAIGKHLFLHFEQATVHVHLGLFGKFRRSANPPPEPKGALRMRLVGETKTWDLRGPTACAVVDAEALAELENRLGADPLAEGADPKIARKKLQKSRRAIGAVLLDQSIFAGIGNVYRAEILFLLRVHPETPACELSKRSFDALWALTKKLLERGVKENRIVTREVPAGTRRTRRESLHVYKRKTCLACGGPVTTLTLAARTIYLCETCQARPAKSEETRASA